MFYLLLITLTTIDARAGESAPRCKRNPYTGTCSSMTPQEMEYARWHSHCASSGLCYGLPWAYPYQPVVPGRAPKTGKRRAR